jgi:hypothetical protein
MRPKIRDEKENKQGSDQRRRIRRLHHYLRGSQGLSTLKSVGHKEEMFLVVSLLTLAQGSIFGNNSWQKGRAWSCRDQEIWKANEV